MNVNKNKHDISQIFLVFMALVGDAEKTALALDLTPDFVTQLAAKEGWAEKVKRISVLSKTGQPGDWERAQNRALNFVQAHQLRRIVDNAITRLSEMEVSNVFKLVDEEGETTYSAKFLCDLTTSMERIHRMSYEALGDSAKERALRAEADPTASGSAATMHAALISALNKSKLSSGPAEKLVEQAVATVEAVVTVEVSATAAEPVPHAG